jgi:hypothetical protein
LSQLSTSPAAVRAVAGTVTAVLDRIATLTQCPMVSLKDKGRRAESSHREQGGLAKALKAARIAASSTERYGHRPYLLEVFFEANDFAVSRCFCRTGMLPFAYSPAASTLFEAFLYSAISF